MTTSLRLTPLGLTLLVGLPFAASAQSFDSPTDNGDGTYTTWLGTFRMLDGGPVAFPDWIVHEEHGPLYLFVNPDERVWMYDPNIPDDNVDNQFIFTRESAYPWFYFNEVGGPGKWRYYVAGAEGEDGRSRIFIDFMNDPLQLGTDEFRDIVELASDTAVLSQLVGAVGMADAVVATTLQAPGPYTVFAPDNDAFAAISDVVAGLSQQELTDILTYHVVDGEVTAEDLIFDPNDIFSGDSNRFSVTALNGDEITIEITGMGVMLNDSALVTVPNVMASNGVVHIIDTVILPPENLAETASSAGLTSLVGAVGNADPAVGAALTGDGPLTVFAPDNDAFTAISDVVAGLDEAALTDVLLYHVISDELTAGDLEFGPDDIFAGEQILFFVQTLLGSDIKVEVTPMGIVLNESAMVTMPDVMASNGVAHVIDEVLLPPGDLATRATELGFAELVAAVTAADPAVAAALTGEGPLTVFAPTDAAFQAIADTVNGLTQAELTQILLYHVVPGKVYSSEVPLDTPITTADAAGNTVTVTVDMDGNLMVNGANIIATDVIAGNGVIHVIDQVILPPSGD